MDDSEITAALAAGDRAGLPAAYDKYAAGLYAYCRWLLREPAPAADALVKTFVAAAAGLGGLKDAGETRAWFYAAARAECYRVRDAGASSDSQAEEAARDRQVGRHRRPRRGPVFPPAEETADLTDAGLAGFQPPEHEATELSLRHGLSEAELAAVLDVSSHQAHALAARARDHQMPPSLPPDTLPPELREHVLRSVAVGAAPPSGEETVRRARSAGLAGLQRLGKLVAWGRIRANPGAATAAAAVAVWVVAAMGATVITLTGMHFGRALATQTHRGKPPAATPAVSSAASPSTQAIHSRSPRPSRSTHAGVAAPTRTSASPTRSVKPTPSRSTPSASPSPSSSASPSPTPSPSSSSPSPSPSSS